MHNDAWDPNIFIHYHVRQPLPFFLHIIIFIIVSLHKLRLFIMSTHFYRISFISCIVSYQVRSYIHHIISISCTISPNVLYNNIYHTREIMRPSYLINKVPFLSNILRNEPANSTLLPSSVIYPRLLILLIKLRI